MVVDGRPLDVTIRAWPDDPAWAERTGALVEQSVPILSESIGLPWVAGRPFVVAEAVSQTGSAYAGRYDPEDATVEIAYYADELGDAPRDRPRLVRRQLARRPLGERRPPRGTPSTRPASSG